jgi:ankyrin repeat protein
MTYTAVVILYQFLVRMSLCTFVLFAISTLPVVRADGWDGFSNNLATDLAPFLSLFGEQVTKQYLSESVTTLDYFIFAMAPMGVLTAVVSAIRVCGSPALRAFIGRAQEGAGSAEAELCSSTSRDVCELYNNGGIARVFGRPKILEIVYDPDHDVSDEKAGIYTFQEYVQGKGQGQWIKKEPRKGQKDAESAKREDLPQTSFAPNLSLNIGIKKLPPTAFWAIAVTGLILQVGVVGFAGVVTYYLRWEKNGSLPESYACPLVIIGTLLVCGGMFHCAFIVGQRTDKEVWQRKPTDGSSMYWVQPGGQVIGDQTFDAFAHKESDDPKGRLEEYMTSRKNVSVDSKPEVWIAVGTTLSGFVLQFIGLRGVHSTVSVAQLGAVMLMSTARAALRMQRVEPNANSLANFPDEVLGHELDWLALRIGQDVIKNDLELPSPGSSFSSQSFDPPPQYFWKLCGAPDRMSRVRREQSHSLESRNAAARLLAYRTRLAQLTSSSPARPTRGAMEFNIEMVEVRRESQQLAEAIEATVNTIFSKAEIKREWKQAHSMCWGIKCTLFSKSPGPSDQAKGATISRNQHILYLTLTRPNDQNNFGNFWRLENRQELEGLLGLWIWSLKSDPAIESKEPETNFTTSKAADIGTRRIISTAQNFTESALGVWLSSDINGFETHKLRLTPTDHGDASTIWQVSHTDQEKIWEPLSATWPGQQQLRFFGWNTAQLPQVQTPETFKLCSVPTNNSLLSSCTQEVFASFLTSVLDVVDDVGDFNIKEAESLRLENRLVNEIVELFTDLRLGSKQEALTCVVPLLVSRLDIRNANKALTATGLKAALNGHEAIIKQLLASGQVDPNARDSNGEPMMVLATKNGHEAIVKLLLAGGQNPDTKNRRDETPLYWATVYGHEAIAKHLLATGQVDPRARNNSGRTPLEAVIEKRYRHEAIVVHYLSAGQLDPRLTNQDGETPLWVAAWNGHEAAVKQLLATGHADPDARNKDGQTPLGAAARKGYDGIVKQLLATGQVYPDAATKNRETPLMVAVSNGHEGIVKQLLATRQVSLHTTRIIPDWRSPLELAMSKGYRHEAILKLLQQYEAST